MQYFWQKLNQSTITPSRINNFNNNIKKYHEIYNILIDKGC